MNYYEWLGQPGGAKIEVPEIGQDGLWFPNEGKPVSNWDENLTAVYTGPDLPFTDFCLAHWTCWPIFSPRLRQLMEKLAPGMVQYLPLRFQQADGSGKIAGYCVGQILSQVDCLDRQLTKVDDDKWEPIDSVRTCHPIVLSRPMIGDAKLFRIRGDSAIIVIREDLKNAIEAQGWPKQRFDYIRCSDEHGNLIPVPIEEQQLEGQALWDYYDRFYCQLFAPLQAMLGPLDPDIIGGELVGGFPYGGPVKLSTIGRGSRRQIVTYVTSELAAGPEPHPSQEGWVPPPPKPSEHGRFELIMSCDNEDWARNVLTGIAYNSFEEALGDGHTLDISAIVHPSEPLQTVVMEEACRAEIDGQPYCILRCIGITRKELEYARQHSSGALLDRLKEAGVYPNSEIRRRSVV